MDYHTIHKDRIPPGFVGNVFKAGDAKRSQSDRHFHPKPEMQKGLSLTDTSIIREAHNYKKKRSSFGYKVHIWTRDRELKAREPDSERNPFL